jgi:hypothetical protein
MCSLSSLESEERRIQGFEHLKVMVMFGKAMAIAVQSGGSSELRFIDFPSAEELLPIQGRSGGVAAAHRRHVLFMADHIRIQLD